MPDVWKFGNTLHWSLMNLRSACCPDRAFAKVQSTFIKTPSHFMFTQRMYFSWLQKMVTQKMWQFMPFIKGILVVVKNCRLKTNLILDVNIKSQRFSWKLSLPIFVSKMHIYKNLPLKKKHEYLQDLRTVCKFPHC